MAARKVAVTSLPADFAVTPEMRVWAKNLGIVADLDVELAFFKDHHEARGNQFASWTAAFRTWLRRTLVYGPSNRSRYANGDKTITYALLPVPANGTETEQDRERRRQQGLAEVRKLVASLSAAKGIS